jgi:hypothetical protein
MWFDWDGELLRFALTTSDRRQNGSPPQQAREIERLGYGALWVGGVPKK